MIHGTYAGYQAGCRNRRDCPNYGDVTCLDAKTAYAAAWTERNRPTTKKTETRTIPTTGWVAQVWNEARMKRIAIERNTA